MICQHCKKRPAAFQVKHPETSLHWRCVHCVREWALGHDLPFIVFGAITKNRSSEMVDHVAAGRMADALRSAARGGGR